jgi:putative protease
VNPWTVEALAGLGAGMVWASPELSGRQLAALVAASPLPVGALVFGRLELMVAEHCVIGTGVECRNECAACARRRRHWTLRDQKGYEFPVTTDTSGRTHLYNAVTLDLSRSVRELLDAGVASMRLELHTLSAEGAAEATRAWRGVLDAALAGSVSPEAPLVEPATSGHFYRGVR